MPTLFVKPNQTPVRNPDKGYEFLPAHGASVPRNVFWLRRMADKSVTEITEAEFKKGREAAEKKATKEAAAVKKAADAEAAKNKTNTNAAEDK